MKTKHKHSMTITEKGKDKVGKWYIQKCKECNYVSGKTYPDILSDVFYIPVKKEVKSA